MAERQAQKEAPVEISFERARCKKCGYCAEFCPKKVLSMDGGAPVVARLDLCTGCGLCEAICPDFAVRVVRRVRNSRER